MSGKFVVLYILFQLSAFGVRSCNCVTMLKLNEVVVVRPKNSYFLSSNLHIFCYYKQTYSFAYPFVFSELIFTPFKGSPVKVYEGISPKEIVTKYKMKSHIDLHTHTSDIGDMTFMMYPESGRQYCYGFQTDQKFAVGVRRVNISLLVFGFLIWFYERRVAEIIFYGNVYINRMVFRFLLKLLAVFSVIRSTSVDFADGPGPTFLMVTLVYKILKLLKCRLPFTIKIRLRSRAADPRMFEVNE